MDVYHDEAVLAEAAEAIEKVNTDLSPELLSAADTRALVEAYARIHKMTAYGLTMLAPKMNDPQRLARAAGTTITKAKEAAATGKIVGGAPVLDEAMKHGEVSFEQAAEIAKAEESSPGAAEGLLETAKEQSFQVLRDSARRVKFEAEQHRDLGKRQREERSAKSYPNDLGMVNVHLSWEPHVGTPIVNRAEAEAKRLYKAAKKDGTPEPFERYLADAYAKLLDGKGKGSTTRPELVVLVSHEVAKRGWTDVQEGEHCKIPGVGPVPPQVARDIAQDAFITGVFFDGQDLRQIKR